MKKTLDLYNKSFVYYGMIKKEITMKKTMKGVRPKKLKKHTSTKDVGYGTKKISLDDMKMDNVMFDTLNDGFENTDMNFEDDLYDGIDELEDF